MFSAFPMGWDMLFSVSGRGGPSYFKPCILKYCRGHFDYISAKWDWKRECLKMEWQASVGPDLNDRSKRTTSRGGPLFPENFHLDRSVPFMF